MPFFKSKLDETDIINAANFAEAAYSDGILKVDGYHRLTNQDLPDFINKDGFFESGWAAASIFKKGNSIVLSIRGTDDIVDILGVDQAILQDGYPKQYTTNHFKALLEAIESKYGNTITVTGHSLGGAVVNDISERSEFFGLSSKSKFFAFSSPYIEDKTINIGFENENPIKGFGGIYEHQIVGDKNLFRNMEYFGFHNDGKRSTSASISVSHSILSVEDGLADIAKSQANDFIKMNSSINILGFCQFEDVKKIEGSYYSYRNLVKGISDKDNEVTLGVDQSSNFVTLSRNDYIDGTKFRDIIDGLSGFDILNGRKGNDILYGNVGNDVLTGGVGKDSLFGGAGSDEFAFGGGDVEKGEVIDGGSVTKGEINTIVAASSVDFRLATISNINRVEANSSAELHFSDAQIQTLIKAHGAFSGAGNLLIDANGTSKNYSYLEPYIAGLTGHLILNGTDTAETIIGTSRVDVIYGQGGDDVLDAGGGADSLYGGADNDKFVLHGSGATAGIRIDGGTGNDNLLVDGDINLGAFKKIASIEGITFASSGTVTFNDAFNVSGLTSIVGSSGVDKLYFNPHGSIDLSTLNFSNWGSSDVITIQGGDRVVGSSQNDVINGAYNVHGGAGNDTITGSGYLDGGADADHITGSSGLDTLVGDNAGDVLIGGGGNDTFDLSVPGITVSAAGDFETVIFHYDATVTSAYQEATGLTNAYINLGEGAKNITASFSNATSAKISGNDEDNTFNLAPAGGIYLVYGGGGNDVFDIGNGATKGELFVEDFESGKDKISLSGVSGFANYGYLTEELASGFYLVRYGTARDYAVYDHEVEGNSVHNTQMYVITSQGDYFVESDFQL